VDPKTYQELVQRTDLTLDEKLEMVFAELPPETEQEAVERRAVFEDEYYLETADRHIVGFSLLLDDWVKATKQTYGEASPEHDTVVKQVEPIQQKLEEYRRNVSSMETRRVVEAVSSICAEYRGWNQGDDGKLQTTTRAAGPEIVSDFWRRTSHGLS